MRYICTNCDRDIGTRRRGVSPQHLMAVRQRWVLRSAATFALLCALAGCRFEVSPDSIDVSANVGQSITESLEIRNTGDEPVDLTLVAEGAAVTLSTTAGVLQAGEVVDIEISAECSSPGERRTDIAVTGRTGNKAITVHVPFVLRCQAETGTHLVSLELFQGPPIYKKDYRAGTETEPVPMMRPENGATPVERWTPPYYVEETGERIYPSKAYVWSAEHEGLVTALWGRRAAVAVTILHMDDSPTPEVSASVGAAALPTLLQETVSAGDGFETVTVFDLARDLYERGAVLDVSVETGEGKQSDQVTLFGETVEPVQLSWVPIVVEGFPPPQPDAEDLTDNLASMVPIAERIVKTGPPMNYVEKGTDLEDEFNIDVGKALQQLKNHHALHACEYDEIYLGIWNAQAFLDEDDYFYSGAAARSSNLSSGNTLVGPGPVDFESPPIPKRMQVAISTFAHELGHLFGLSHTPCGVEPRFEGKEYPYGNNAELGPAPLWETIFNRFIGAGDGFHDNMSYCGPRATSDFSYQMMVMYRQHDYASRTCEAPRPGGDPNARSKPGADPLVTKSAAVDGVPKSIAIAGAISADGIASISMVQPTGNPPWAPRPDGEYTLELLDAGGTVLHRQPIRANRIDHGHGEALWGARVPYVDGAATLLVRGQSGDVRATATLPR